MTFAPIGAVAAVRESSVLFATAIGAVAAPRALRLDALARGGTGRRRARAGQDSAARGIDSSRGLCRLIAFAAVHGLIGRRWRADRVLAVTFRRIGRRARVCRAGRMAATIQEGAAGISLTRNRYEAVLAAADDGEPANCGAADSDMFINRENDEC